MARKVLKKYTIYNTRRLKAPPEDEIEGELPTKEFYGLLGKNRLMEEAFEFP